MAVFVCAVVKYAKVRFVDNRLLGDYLQQSEALCRIRSLKHIRKTVCIVRIFFTAFFLNFFSIARLKSHD